ncbi:FGGY-family carbohydrate kinase [Sinorhizobium alkalisoli]|uniref:FGGY-family carbohydrate kinase n=1 Tax=Sinorhizobium alkalisoli TaxID=1752398 RepID=UPI00124C94F6|nr:FGGY-family carbohydrate kinase [Sinorhizobium alkalisoli]MCA1493882.1 FGGY-family carbohydrate kinase [Ensifer sp. NBAIM29]MCG5478304.1 FGGY-family carbohydrate kinase [Sinorhizobium alkalisoli]QFI66257.1 D-ribulokinase [Sinorhizobium alkalisoli]
MDRYLIGIDVGTASARAGIFDSTGRLLAAAKQNIALFSDGPDLYEQSSEDIWQAVCASIRRAIGASGIDPNAIAGIGVDATCSLVVIGAGGRSLPVGDLGHPERNIIVWMDHRALGQANRINDTRHDVLRFVGNRISPEMETPKLLWLKENKPETFNAAEHFFDLTDFLTWRATDCLARSICTVTCKWTYLGHERRWDESYFRTVGLSELTADNFARIGSHVVEAGTALGSGLTPRAASELGLPVGVPVAAGLIDAHAGGVGTVGWKDEADGGSATSRMAYVFGTSACTMTSTHAPAFVPGVWGPYYSAMVPGLWLNEAGQSAAGAAIDHLLSLHPASAEAARLAEAAGMGLAEWLAARAAAMAAGQPDLAILADGLHVVPEFLGNRAPFADPEAKALIAGLSMDRSVDSLIRLYVAGVCGLGCGLRQIVEAQQAEGVSVDTIVVSGGAGRSPIIRQLLADATGLKVAAPATDEPVLLGAAMLAAVASGLHPNLEAAMAGMSGIGDVYTPKGGEVAAYHAKRFEGFELLQSTGRRLRTLYSRN